MSEHYFSISCLRAILSRALLAILVLSSGCSTKRHNTISRGLGGMGHNSKNVILKDTSYMPSYKESHALVIGVSDYSKGWPPLPGVKEDVRLVSATLKDKGFDVTTVMNPNRSGLDTAFGNFIKKYGGEENNRLVFYFAGHGYTVKPKYGGSKLGYLVPIGAPNPHKDLSGFRQIAMSMSRIEEYALNIDSKHVIFLFDSCFSGSIFSISRAIPENIQYNASKPVRQFITAGDENETVPDVSIFRQMFVDGLNGEGDIDKDGYITGSELGQFMQKSVINYSKGAQHPQYGKIRNPNLDKGDFIFSSTLKAPASPPKNPFILPELELDENEKEWKDRLAEMKRGFKDASNYQDRSILPKLKIKAWKNFIYTFNDDNPYTDEDEELIKKAEKRTRYLLRLTTKNIVKGPKITNSIGMEFIYISPGSFIMGSDLGKSDESPPHEVKVDGFYMQTTEVTQGQWEEIMGKNPSHFINCGGDCPVEQVSWNDAQRFIEELNTREATEKYRLPSEAEWEYASRAGSTTEYSDVREGNLENYAWYYDNSGDEIHPVAEKDPNVWGLFDMSGNVWEWCNDWYADYSLSVNNNTAAPVNGSVRVNRGGSFNSIVQYIRSSYRNSAAPRFKFYNIGFRIIMKPPNLNIQ